MTPQEIFNKAYLGVLRQGKLSQDVEGVCLYRAPRGLKCAVGHLLTDAEAEGLDDRNSPLGTVSLMRSSRASQLPGYFKANLDLLQDLQEAHDGSYSIAHFRDRCALVAEDHKLEVPVT